MNVTQQDLDTWRAFAETVRTASFRIRLEVAQGHTQAAKDALDALHNAAVAAGKGMEAAGALRPGTLPPTRPTPPELRDTPTNRRYLEALEAAHAAALERDRELYGASIGAHGRAQIIQMVRDDVAEELAPTARERLAEKHRQIEAAAAGRE